MHFRWNQPQNFRLEYLHAAAIIALPFFILASHFLIYCIHHDEHFQIMEFAHFKRGLSVGNKLAWEYDAKLRPTIQPAIAYLLLELMDFVSLTDPFKQAFVMRMLSSLLFIFTTLKLCRTLSPEISSSFQKYVCLYLSLFFFMFPFSGVRYSSENISSCLFTLAFSLLFPVLKGKEQGSVAILVKAGLLLGISFLFRYQSALLTFGLAAWLTVFRFSQFKHWLIMFLAFSVAAGSGILIDRWFYGSWTCTAWNYLNFNIVEGKSAGFGVSPWHFYFTSIDWSKWPRIVNLYLVSGTLLFTIARFKHPVTWIFTTFLLVHLVIPHKEMRFLYPILIFVPFMVTSSFDFLVTHFPQLSPFQKALIPVMVINFIIFLVMSISPLDNSIAIFNFVGTLPNKPIKIYYSETLFHYTLRDSRKAIAPSFYYDCHEVIGVEETITDLDALQEVSPDADTLTFVILNRWQQEALGNKYQPVFDPLPAFIHKLNYRNWMKHGFNSWKLYRLKPHQNTKQAK